MLVVGSGFWFNCRLVVEGLGFGLTLGAFDLALGYISAVWAI